jgi:hypothetical protein
MKRPITRTVTGIALLLSLAAAGTAAPTAFSPEQDQVMQWTQTADAVTLLGDGFLGHRFVRLEDGDSVATYITTSAIADSMYGMTAALALFAPGAMWALEVFAGGTPEAGSLTPAGATLLISASGSLPTVSNEDDPEWYARGTGHSPLLYAPAAGVPVWLRVRAIGGSIGVDSVLGVENDDVSIWFPGSDPTQLGNTNWDFELDSQANAPLNGVPEPVSLSLTAPALLALFCLRRR